MVIVLGVWLIFGNSEILHAQKDELQFKQITTKDGLLDDVVLSIEQDDKGYMWFGTRSGLVRYDGVNLQSFTYNPDQPDGLSGNNINGLHIDKSGVLWIGTINGLCRFDEKLNRPLKVLIKIYDKIIEPFIRGISSSSNGLIWLATLDHGLISFDPISKRSTQFLHNEDKSNSILNNRISTVNCSSEDQIWIGTFNGLNRYDQQNNSFTAYKNEEGNSKTISGDKVTSIAAGRNGDIWVGTLNSGLNKINTLTGEVTIYNHEPDNMNSLSSNYISSIFYDEDRIWIGSGRGLESLNMLNTKTGIIKRFNNSSENKLISGSSTNGIFKDRTGIIWIARSYNGIKYFDTNWDNYEQHLIDNDGSENLLNRIYGINPISNSKIWCSTFDGLVLYDLKKGLLKRLQNTGDNTFLNNNSIFVNDELWVPSRQKGILSYNLKTEKLSYLSHTSNNNKSISSNYVNVLLRDNDGIVWAGSRDGGLDRIDPKTNEIKRFKYFPGNTESLPENSVYSLLEESNNKLWVGTNGGLALFDIFKETFLNYPHDPKDSLSISSNQISHILKDSSNTLWVGTYGGGLNKFDASAKTFRRYTSQKNNLPNNTVYSFVEDDSNNLWVSTAMGIARFSPTTETYDYLIPLPDNYKVNKFPNGNICFSGPRGILVFDPNKIKFNSFPPIISLVDFSTNEVNLSKIVADSLLYVIKTKREIELDYLQNDLKFDFTVAHYSNASKNKLKVYLEGYDNNWHSLGSVMSINYTNLDPGKYILKAKGASAYGVWTDKPITFTIIINPPWWKTWWAYSIYALTLLGFLYTVRKFELKRQRKNSEIKEGKLRAEAAELQAKAAEAQARVIQAENDRKSKELEEARQLQLSMLPKKLPEIKNLDIAVFMQTATEVGGDYYDFHVGEDNSLSVALGDATGHGMQAGTLVTLIKGLFTSEVHKKRILDFFGDANKTIKEINLGRLMMAFSLLKIKGNQLLFSSAGLPPMYIYRNSTNSIDEIDMQGMPLGAMRNFKYNLYKTELSVGDCIILLSDGYPELANSENEQIGYERLQIQLLEVSKRKPKEIIEYLKDYGSMWVADKDPDDDVTFVVIKVK